MIQKYSHKLMYLMLLLAFPIISSANYVKNPSSQDALLTYKNSQSHQLCTDKPFYINDIDIMLSKKGELFVSLSEIAKSHEGFVTHLTVELLDYKGRILTTYDTPTLTMNTGDPKDKKSIRKGRVKNFYFTENFKYQFNAEEYQIFINNVKEIRVKYNGCNTPNLTAEVNTLKRKLPREIVDEFIHKAPLVIE